MGDYFTILGIV